MVRGIVVPNLVVLHDFSYASFDFEGTVVAVEVSYLGDLFSRGLW